MSGPNFTTEHVTLSDGQELVIELTADEDDTLQLVIWRHRSAGGRLVPVPGAGVVIAMEDVREVFEAVSELQDRVERADDAGGIVLEPEV